MKRWSKLQKEVEKLFAEGLDLRIQCRVYRMSSQLGRTGLPRYWITLNKKVIWDYPKDFEERCAGYPHVTEVSDISDLLREYIDTPVEQLSDKRFDDPWSLVELLRAADRRIGRRKLPHLEEQLRHPAARAILEARWSREPQREPGRGKPSEPVQPTR